MKRWWIVALAVGGLSLLVAGADGGSASPPAEAPTAPDGGQLHQPMDTPAEAKAEPATPPADRGQTGEAAAVPRFEQMRAKVGEQPLGSRLVGLLGLMCTLGLAFLMSNNRRAISWQLVIIGTSLQFVFALLVLKTTAGEVLFRGATQAVNKLLSFSVDGARFVFGNLVDPAVPVTQAESTTQFVAKTGAFLAFGVLPSIWFFSALTSVLYYFGVLQWVVRGMAAIMRRTMGTSGAESLSASANIFVGQTEAPLLVRPYLSKMTQSEMMAVMTGGFATVAGGVMAVYVGLLYTTFPDIAGHLLAASVMSAPASLVMAKIVVPETEVPVTAAGAMEMSTEGDDGDETANFLDAITKGTTDGLKLALNVGAMLISFVALIALANWGIGALGELFGMEGLSLQRILGWILAPLAFCLGVPWEDAPLVGGLMGTKTVVNEFVAYLDLAGMMGQGGLKHPKSVVIATYALCGFSNFGSIGIQIGGLASIAPSRRADLARLGLRSMIAASLACFQTAALAGILI